MTLNPLEWIWGPKPAASGVRTSAGQNKKAKPAGLPGAETGAASQGGFWQNVRHPFTAVGNLVSGTSKTVGTAAGDLVGGVVKPLVLPLVMLIILAIVLTILVAKSEKTLGNVGA